MCTTALGTGPSGPTTVPLRVAPPGPSGMLVVVVRPVIAARPTPVRSGAVVEVSSATVGGTGGTRPWWDVQAPATSTTTASACSNRALTGRRMVTGPLTLRAAAGGFGPPSH